LIIELIYREGCGPLFFLLYFKIVAYEKGLLKGVCQVYVWLYEIYLLSWRYPKKTYPAKCLCFSSLLNNPI